MKQLLSREVIFNLFYVLNNDLANVKECNKYFAFAYDRNVTYLKPEIVSIINARESSIPEFKEFEQKREAILNSKCKKDENGNPIVINNAYSFDSVEVQQSIQIELEALRIQYEPFLMKRQEEVNIYNEIIMEPIEVDVCQVSFKYLPESITPNNLNALRPMIKETDAEIEAML